MNTHTFRFQTQPMQLGLGGKLLAGMLAVLLLVGGFFTTLLMLSIAGGFVAVTLLKLWWSGKSLSGKTYVRKTVHTTHTQQGQIIEGEYQVKQQSSTDR